MNSNYFCCVKENNNTIHAVAFVNEGKNRKKISRVRLAISPRENRREKILQKDDRERGMVKRNRGAKADSGNDRMQRERVRLKLST